MIPRLYDESVLNTPDSLANPEYNGYGFFTSVIKCEINEVRNGEYTLEMEITDTDRLADVTKPNMLIKAKANPDDDPQLFEIYSVIENNGIITISANHISYLFENDIICRTRLYEETGDIKYLVNTDTIRSTTVAGVITYLIDREENIDYAYFSTMDSPRRRFSFTSDVTDRGDFKFYEYIGKTLGELMKGTGGSLLDVFGGEYQYDNFNIYLKQRRGRTYQQTGKVLRYGANLGDNTKALSSDNTYTHVCCWARAQDITNERERKIIGSPIRLVDASSVLFEKVKMIDVSDQLQEDWKNVRTKTTGRYSGMSLLPESNQPTVSGAGSNTQGYDRIWAFCTDFAEQISNGNTRPASETQVSLTVNSASELKSLQDIRLCDEISVVLKDGTRVNEVKCTSVIYDSINEKYINMGFGSKRLSITDFFLKKRR